jgi:hypothetical protein
MNNKEFFTVVLLTVLLYSCSPVPQHYREDAGNPKLFPDIAGVTVPVNIAPLNFRLDDSSEKVVAVFRGSSSTLTVSGKNRIIIPEGKWHRLLRGSSDNSIIVTLFSRDKGVWKKYNDFNIYVKGTPVDPWLVYRLIAPGYQSWSEMGIYQRNLTSFDEDPVIDNRLLPGNCMNCHSFNGNNPDEMVFHLRGKIGATMLIRKGEVLKLNTKTSETISNCVYPYWHPSGNYIAFSVNTIFQYMHTRPEKRIEVNDSKSDIVVLDIKNNKLISSGLISAETSFETFPAFSSDGNSLFFCSAEKHKMPDDFDKVKYSLCRISFDPSTGTFGDKIDTLVSASATGKSVSFPRPSGDGRKLMFTMSDYGNFSIWHPEADLYMLDLKGGTFAPVSSANSGNTESYHSWSSESRWFVFSSRRIDGLYTRPYIAWADENGNVTKPFLLPQKDPDFYDFCLRSFNIPEFVKSRVSANGKNMLRAIYSTPIDVGFEKK